MKKSIEYDLAAYRNLPYEARREYQQSIDIVHVERAATQLFAGLVNLQVDRDIFRHAIPPHQKSGYGVRVFRIAPGCETDVCKFELAVWGRSDDHDELRLNMSRMALQLPLSNELIQSNSGSPVIFSAIFLTEPVSFAPKYENAQVQTEGVILAEAWVLTVPENFLTS